MQREPRPASADSGNALIWSLLFVVIASGMIISHSILITANRRESDVRYTNEALSANFSSSGLSEALGWFRRQEVQPVTAFAPQLDPEADPPIFDTIDPTLGLVREFEIHGNLWGRYEVRTDDVVDISLERGITTPGSVWEIGVRSFVYRRVDPAVAFDSVPNRVVSMASTASELRGIRVQLPIVAALNLENLAGMSLGPNTTITGGDMPAVGYDDLGDPASDAGVVAPGVTGTPVDAKSTTFDASPEAVFGMSMGDFIEFAEIVLASNPVPGTLLDLPVSSAVITQSIAEPVGIQVELGALVVRGNLDLPIASSTVVHGLLYVEGNLTVGGDLKVVGSTIVRGNFVTGTGAVDLVFDAWTVDRVRSKLGSYKLPRLARPK